jgi:iron complex outermembrane receptor protein
LGANLGSITRQTGAYVIVNIPPGTYVLVAERVGLGRLTRQITVTPGGLVEADFAMTP